MVARSVSGIGQVAVIRPEQISRRPMRRSVGSPRHRLAFPGAGEVLTGRCGRLDVRRLAGSPAIADAAALPIDAQVRLDVTVEKAMATLKSDWSGTWCAGIGLRIGDLDDLLTEEIRGRWGHAG